jgi:hypothetical protein
MKQVAADFADFGALLAGAGGLDELAWRRRPGKANANSTRSRRAAASCGTTTRSHLIPVDDARGLTRLGSSSKFRLHAMHDASRTQIHHPLNHRRPQMFISTMHRRLLSAANS